MESLAEDAALGKFDPLSLIPAEIIAARDAFLEQEGLKVPEPVGEMAQRLGIVKDFFTAQ